MEKTPSLRQFAEWAIGLTDKYRYNPFIRTAVHITLLQIALAALMVLVFSWGIEYAQQHTLDAIKEQLAQAALGHADSTALYASVEDARRGAYGLVFFLITGLTVLFGYFMARIGLRPTRESIRVQKQFIGNIAHEIRTPLAIIKTNTEVALFDETLDAEVRSTFEDTLVELDRISEIINNLLTFDTFSRPRAMKFEPVDLRQIAETVIRRHEHLARERGIRLAMDTGRAAYVNGNATALEQVITNLVKNALNYTPKNQHGSVRILIEHDSEGRIALTVADTGIGIAQKDLMHIFEPFYRGDTARTRGVGTGTSGLGLAIVNEIVRLHQGSISIRSAIGRGTAVKMLFPPIAAEGDDELDGADVYEVDFR